MKWIAFYIFVGLLGYLVYTNPGNPIVASAESKLSYSVCDSPIHYKVETVDPRFNISSDQFQTDIKQAGELWSKAYGKELFVYDPKGALSINMIYDDRQSLNTQINSLEDQLNSQKTSLNPEISDYQTKAADFKSRVAALNENIASWNAKGGAPEDEYNKILKEQADLKTEASELNSMAQKLNLSTEEYNTQVNNLNGTIHTFKEAITERPEEGIFKGREDRIEIYFNVNQSELIHTLTHEMGHSLGLDHNQNPDSIMYPTTSKAQTLSETDISDLNKLCAPHSVFDILKQRIQLLISSQGQFYYKS